MKSKWLVGISGYIPIVLLAVVTIVSVFDISNELLQILCTHFGSSTTSLLFMLFTVFNTRMRFCLIAKIATVSLLLNQLLYIIGEFINYEVYGNLYTIICFISAILIWIILLYKEKKLCGANLLRLLTCLRRYYIRSF